MIFFFKFFFFLSKIDTNIKLIFAGCGRGGTEKFAVSDYSNEENIPGNLNPQVAPEPPLREAPRAPLGELPPPPPPPQSQLQQAGPTEGNLPLQETSLECVRVAEYHDPSITRWKTMGTVRKHEALTNDFYVSRFSRDPKPILPRTYLEIERRYEELRSLALEWVELWFAPEPTMPEMTGPEVRNLGIANPLLVRWIDDVASAYGICWMHLLDEKRHLIAMGVLGKVLEDRVFKSEFFGAGKDERKVLREIDGVVGKMEVDAVSFTTWPVYSDAFARQKPRATYINESLLDPTDLPKYFAAEVNTLYIQLVVLLQPLLPTQGKECPSEKYYEMLNWIVAIAAKLSLDLRREPDTIYYVATTPPREEGLDFERMSPVIFDENERDYIAACYDNFTNVISVWPGLIAYRRLPFGNVSIRAICQALVFTLIIKDEKHPHGTDSNPEKTCSEPQFWQYLKFLGAPIKGDGRAPYIDVY